MSKNIQIVQLREHDLNRGVSKDSTPVFPITKASAIEGMSELLDGLNINGVTPISDISSVTNPEKGKIYYEESTDKYYVYSEDKSNFVELGAGPSVDPSDVMPTITQEASTQSGGDNIITFTFPNGETTQIVIKNGTQGNSGYTGAAGELEVVNNLEDGGATAALSAEMGKELAQQSLIESGTFAKAYLKAVDVNVPFPWVLKDTDGNGNSITKMIWHIGNREFVDAAGADVNWYKDGITIITAAPCKLRVADVNSANAIIDLPLNTGFNNIPFSMLHKEGSSVDEKKIFGGCFINMETTNTTSIQGDSSYISTEVLYVNFGGLTVANIFKFYTNSANKLKAIDNLVMRGSVSSWNFWLNHCDNLEHLGNIRGNLSWGSISSGVFVSSLAPLRHMIKLDLKELVGPIFTVKMMPYLNYLDIRGMNPKLCGEYTLGETKLGDMSNLKTLIIGNFDTSTITGDGNKQFLSGNVSNLTLVCTNPIPPATNSNGYIINELLTKATTILVPSGSKSAYTANTATWWKDYASKMSEYSQGEY